MMLLGVFTTIYPDGEMTLSRALLISLVGVCVVFAILGVIALFVKIMGAAFDRFSVRSTPAAAFPSVPEQQMTDLSPLPDNTSQGTLTLENVTEEEAAVSMAIVSNRSGIPLNRLQFNSIRLLEEPKA